MTPRYHIWAIICICLLSAPGFAAAEEPTPDEIMARSYAVNGGDDLSARLTFTFESEGEAATRTTLLMAYKNYHGEQGLDSKLIMFSEFPPDKRDVGFLGWLYAPGAGKQDDMWLYLPELRTVRKMGGMHDRHHHHDDDGDETYKNSQLDREELSPRPPQLDHHRLLGMDTVEGLACYMVEGQPIDSRTSAYGRRITWVTQDHYLPVRIEYYDQDNRLAKRQSIAWQHRGDAWFWDEVNAVNIQNGRRTRLVQTDVKINSDLPDNLFTKRILAQGANSLLGRIERPAQ